MYWKHTSGFQDLVERITMEEISIAIWSQLNKGVKEAYRK
jgi:hypothetical protein